MNKKIKKIGKAVAGSALLVGATLTGAAGLASAASGTQDLGDYPQPFVSEDGQVQSTIVVGESAKTIDVVGAINVAGSLSQAAFMEEQQSVSAGSSSWTVSNGATLDTVNDKLYYGSTLDQVRSTLTGNDLDALQTSEFEDASGSTTEVKYYLYPGSQSVKFAAPDSNEDPALMVDVPAESSVKLGKNTADNLYQLQANFQSGGLELTDTSEDDNRNAEVFGEEVELFGQTFTIGENSFNSNNAGKLILYGSSETVDVDSGDSSTISVDGNEHTIEVVGVTGSDVAAFRVDGTLMEKNEGDTFSVDGQDVRVDDIIQTNSQTSDGVVSFSVGSEKLVLQDNKEVRRGQDEDRIKGTKVKLDYTDNSGTDGNGVIETGDNDDFTLSSISVAVGSDDNDVDYLMADETFQDPVFSGVRFSFGGLAPNAAEGGDNVGEVSYNTAGDDQIEVSFTPSGGSSSVTIPFAHWDTPTGSATPFDLSTDNDGANGDIMVAEGADVQEDQFFTADAGDFPHLFEVTEINVDDTADDNTVTLDDYTGSGSFEVDFNSAIASNSGSETTVSTTEVIDGQTYQFQVADTTNDGTANGDTVRVTYGAGAGAGDAGDETTVYAAMDGASGEAIAFTDDVSVGEVITATNAGATHSIVLPSTESTDAKSVEFKATDPDTGAASGDSTFEYSTDGGSTWNNITATNGTDTVGTFTVGQVDYAIEYDADDSSNQATFEVVSVAVDDGAGNQVTTPGSLIVEPEDDADMENAYVVAPTADASTDDRVELSGSSAVEYTGSTWSTALQLDSDDQEYQSYDIWGTHVMHDRDEEGGATFHVPESQSTAGAAFHGAGATLSAEGGSNSVTTMTPAGWPDAAALDSDISSSDRSQDMILVGGPAVNTLVEELASEDKTWSVSDYSEGQAVLDYVNNAFQEGQDALVVAGYAGEDTREAANYLANYADHESELAGTETKTLTTQQTVQ